MLTCTRCGRDISKHDECYEKDPVVCHGCTVTERDLLRNKLQAISMWFAGAYERDGTTIRWDWEHVDEGIPWRKTPVAWFDNAPIPRKPK